MPICKIKFDTSETFFDHRLQKISLTFKTYQRNSDFLRTAFNARMLREAKHSAMKHSAVKHSALKHSALKHSAMKHSAMNHSAMKHSALKHSALKHSALKHSAMKHSAMNHSAVKHLAMKHSATKHSAMKHSAMTAVHFRSCSDAFVCSIAAYNILYPNIEQNKC